MLKQQNNTLKKVENVKKKHNGPSLSAIIPLWGMKNNSYQFYWKIQWFCEKIKWKDKYFHVFNEHMNPAIHFHFSSEILQNIETNTVMIS